MGEITMQSLIKKVHYFKIPVSDVKAAADWYSTVLGFRPEFVNVEDGIARMDLVEGPFLILCKADSNSNCTFTIDSQVQQIVTFTSPSIDELYNHMKQHNVKTSEIESDEWSRFFNFYDLDNNMFFVHS